MDFDTRTINLNEYLTQYSHSDNRKPGELYLAYDESEKPVKSTVYIDRKFQRLHCWDRSRRRAYMNSVLLRRTTQTAMVADIESCLAYSKRVNCEASVKEFEGMLKNGYKYVSIDGQNRALTQQEFAKVNSDLTITVPEWRDMFGKTHTLNNKLLKDLPLEVRTSLLSSSKLTLTFVRDATYPELAVQFRIMNDNDALGNQEIRNSFLTFLASWVRKHSQSFKSLFQSWKGKTTYEGTFTTRMHDNEWLAIWYLFLGGVFNEAASEGNQKKFFFDVNKTKIKARGPLDKAYEIGDSITEQSNNFPYDTDKLERHNDILLQLQLGAPHLKASNGKIPNWRIWSFLAVFEWLHDNNYHINTSNMKEGVEVILKLISDERYDSKQQQAIDEKLSGKDEHKGNYFYGQLETPTEPTSRREMKYTVASLLSSNLGVLPVTQLSGGTP